MAQYPKQVSVGIQTVFLGCFDQAVNHRTGLGSSWGIGKQPILPAHHKRLYAAFGTIVGEFQSAILQASDQVRPLLYQVMQRLSKG